MGAHEAIVDRLVAQRAVLFGEFTLTSGAKSPYYVDIKKATTDPETLRLVADAIAKEAGRFDLVGGMALGAVPLAVAVALASGKPFVMVRKETRSHGTGKRIEGPDVAGQKVLVVEDVATSGGSAVEAVQVLKEAGAKIDEAWVVVDRESGAAERLQEQGVALRGLVTASDLLARSTRTV